VGVDDPEGLAELGSGRWLIDGKEWSEQTSVEPIPRAPDRPLLHAPERGPVHRGLTRFVDCVRAAFELRSQSFGKWPMQLLWVADRQARDGRAGRQDQALLNRPRPIGGLGNLL
jgi:hypothetical protein